MVAEVFEISGLNDMIPFYKTIEEAVHL